MRLPKRSARQAGLRREAALSKMFEGEIPSVLVTEHDQEVGHGLDVPAPSFGTIYASIINDPGNVNVSRKVTRSYVTGDHTTGVVTRKEIGPGGRGVVSTTTMQYIELTAGVVPNPALGATDLRQTIEKIDEKNALKTTVSLASFASITSNDKLGEFGADVTCVSSIVSPGDAWPTLNHLTVSAKETEMEDGRLQRVICSVTSWPTLLDWEEEEETKKSVSVTYNIVAAGVTPPEDSTSGQVTTYTRIDRFKSLKTVRALHDDYSLIEEDHMHMEGYSYPGVVYGWQTSASASLASRPLFTRWKHSARNTQQWFRTRTTYHDSDPLIATLPTYPAKLFQMFPVDVSISVGDNFSLRESNVLIDGGSITWYVYNAGGAFLYETYTAKVIGSDPTAYAFNTLVTDGTEKHIQSDSIKWKFNLWKQVKTYTVLCSPGAISGTASVEY